MHPAKPLYQASEMLLTSRMRFPPRSLPRKSRREFVPGWPESCTHLKLACDSAFCARESFSVADCNDLLSSCVISSAGCRDDDSGSQGRGSMAKRVLIVGGVAGGATCAARVRRLSEDAEIIVFDRGPYVSFANCGLPYYVGNVIQDEKKLLLASAELFRTRFNIEVRTENEVLSIDREHREIEVKRLQTGEIYREAYEALVLSPGPPQYAHNCLASIFPESSSCAQFQTVARFAPGLTVTRSSVLSLWAAAL